ncbi:MAG: DNA repair exonuclease [Clostridia bacterium]|nr:DNA repair exonuclease [Clostridia bacterium]
MPKIIHAADVHLDAPFSILDIQKAQVRKNELRAAFSSLVLFARTEKADLVILSGDLFDSGFATKETTAHLVSQFASLPDCRFVIAPGNHDPLTPRSLYKKEVFPKNVYIFEEETLSCFSFPEIGVDVYGYAFTSERYTDNPLKNIPPMSRGRINILAAHADLGGNSENCPLSVQDIARSGFDYVALGHIHKGTDVKVAGGTYYAYSGCLEGRSFDECGIKGVIVAELTKHGGQLEASFSKRRLCKRHYEKLSADITGVDSDEVLTERLRSAVAAAGYGADVLLRLRLTGKISPDIKLHPSRITAQMLGLFYLEIEDASSPLLSYDELKNDISIRGALFRELLPMLESENEEERQIAADALRLGLAALDGEDVVDF